jgi:hypothetical protein
MAYTKKEFGLELQRQLLLGNDYNKIAKWAFDLYLEQGLNFEKDLDCIVLKLIAMEEGVEFILSNQDLLNLANELIEK